VTRFLTHRLVLAGVLGVATLVFLRVLLVPGDSAQGMPGESASPEDTPNGAAGWTSIDRCTRSAPRF